MTGWLQQHVAGELERRVGPLSSRQHPHAAGFDAAPLHELVDMLEYGNGDRRAREVEYHRRIGPVLANIRRGGYREMGLEPVPVAGSTARGRRHSYYQATLPDGTVGYVQRRADDCLQAAVATLLQVPVHEVPDAQISRRIREGDDPEGVFMDTAVELDRWAAGAGGRFMVHPARLPRRGRWIGVVPAPAGDVDVSAIDHCVVLDGRDVVWETAKPLGLLTHEWGHTAGDVEYGITFES